MGPEGRPGAAFVTLILITAPIVPFTPIDAVDAAGNSSPETPRELKSDAVSQVEDLNASRRQYISARDRARSRLNESRQYYRGPIRATDGGLFTDDAVAVQALAKFARTGETEDAIAAADTVLRADNRTAHRELADARRLLDEWGPKLDNSGVRWSLEAHLRNAERVRPCDADHQRRESGRRSTRTPVAREFDPSTAVDVATGPPRRRASRPADERHASHGKRDGTRRTGGDIRRHSLGIGARIGRSDLESERGIRANLQSRDQERREGTSRRGHDDSRRGPSSDAKSHRAGGHPESDCPGGNHDSPFRGWPSHPVHCDRKRRRDDRKQRRPPRRDGLTTSRELELTDPSVAETDDDGIRDGSVEFVPSTSPLDPDSDDDDTLDGAEDGDDDGLSTAEELDARTVPWIADTDHDRLSDAAELDRGLDPRDPDTADDFLSDADEGTRPFDTEPTDPDTDGDGNETYTSTARHETLAASAEITGEGNVAGQTTIEAAEHVRYSEQHVPNASVAPVVSFETTTNFSTATISIEYNQSRLSDDASEQNLSIYRFNETSGRWEPVNSTVDAGAHHVRQRAPIAGTPEDRRFPTSGNPSPS